MLATKMRPLHITVLSLLLACGCNRVAQPSLSSAPTLAPQGIWLGKYQGQQLSVEFFPNGRMVLVSGGEDSIGFASFRLDYNSHPAALDIHFDYKDWGTIHTIFEQISEDSIRIGSLEADAPRQMEFGDKTITFYPTDHHIHQRSG